MLDETRIFNPLDLDISRSVYQRSCADMGTCLAGRLYPFFLWNVLPGSEATFDNESLFKMSTPVYPTMDYLYADISYFFVPYKLLLSRRYGTPSLSDSIQSFEAWIGAQDFLLNMPIPATGVVLPLLNDTINTSAPSNPNSLFEALYGVTTSNTPVNALPLLAYFAVWNENYREPNIQTPVTWNFSSGRITFGSSPDICWSDTEISDLGYSYTAGSYHPALDMSNSCVNKSTVLPVSVFHDYFGSMLPWPQRNLTGVSLPLGDFAPLIAKSGASNSLGNGPAFWTASTPIYQMLNTSDNLGNALPMNTNAMVMYEPTTAGSTGKLVVATGATKTNLGVDLRNATAATLEMLRAKIVEQHWYEALARSGNRLDELEYGTFGVRPHDSGSDRPVYLGGKRIQLNMEMVASTEGGTSQSVNASLGKLGAFSHTNDHDFYGHKAFDTWGVVIGVFCIRHANLIASGVDRHWLKSTREEFFWPQFARLGNQYTYKAELSAQWNATTSLDAVGYTEYAEEWRGFRSHVKGLLVPGRSLGFMTYAHNYATNADVTLATVLDASRQWIDVDNTLATTQAAAGFQFIYQMSTNVTMRIPVGKESTPGVTRI